MRLAEGTRPERPAAERLHRLHLHRTAPRRGEPAWLGLGLGLGLGLRLELWLELGLGLGLGLGLELWLGLELGLGLGLGLESPPAPAARSRRSSASIVAGESDAPAATCPHSVARSARTKLQSSSWSELARHRPGAEARSPPPPLPPPPPTSAAAAPPPSATAACAAAADAACPVGCAAASRRSKAHLVRLG